MWLILQIVLRGQLLRKRAQLDSYWYTAERSRSAVLDVHDTGSFSLKLRHYRHNLGSQRLLIKERSLVVIVGAWLNGFLLLCWRQSCLVTRRLLGLPLPKTLEFISSL